MLLEIQGAVRRKTFCYVLTYCQGIDKIPQLWRLLLNRNDDSRMTKVTMLVLAKICVCVNDAKIRVVLGVTTEYERS